jgi:hypothetical protein
MAYTRSTTAVSRVAACSMWSTVRGDRADMAAQGRPRPTVAVGMLVAWKEVPRGAEGGGCPRR